MQCCMDHQRTVLERDLRLKERKAAYIKDVAEIEVSEKLRAKVADWAWKLTRNNLWLGPCSELKVLRRDNTESQLRHSGVLLDGAVGQVIHQSPQSECPQCIVFAVTFQIYFRGRRSCPPHLILHPDHPCTHSSSEYWIHHWYACGLSPWLVAVLHYLFRAAAFLYRGSCFPKTWHPPSGLLLTQWKQMRGARRLSDWCWRNEVQICDLTVLPRLVLYRSWLVELDSFSEVNDPFIACLHAHSVVRRNILSGPIYKWAGFIRLYCRLNLLVYWLEL